MSNIDKDIDRNSLFKFKSKLILFKINQNKI